MEKLRIILMIWLFMDNFAQSSRRHSKARATTMPYFHLSPPKATPHYSAYVTAARQHAIIFAEYMDFGRSHCRATAAFCRLWCIDFAYLPIAIFSAFFTFYHRPPQMLPRRYGLTFSIFTRTGRSLSTAAYAAPCFQRWWWLPTYSHIRISCRQGMTIAWFIIWLSRCDAAARYSRIDLRAILMDIARV